MAYSSIVKPTDYFNTVLWTGDNTARTISGVGFQPDWIWWKQRNGTDSHRLADAVRGEGSASYKLLFSDDTSAEFNGDDNGGSQGNINAITSDGFSGVQGTSGYNNWNGSSYNYVAWNWKGANGTASNGNGSITSTVSANTTAGFSIVSYTGTGANATVGHGLGVAPSLIINKCRSASQNWATYHSSLGGTKALFLDGTDAATTSSSYFNDTAPTTSVFTVGTSGDTNKSSQTHISYCFAEKKGYSKFGSYTGNGDANGTFVYTGFAPAFVLSKCTSHAGENWNINDSKRPGSNVIQNALLPDSTAAEVTASFQALDILSNGFKWRGTNDRVNASGKTYIYAAFAENPFVANDSGTAVPVVAR